MKNYFDLNGRVAIVTVCSTGLGVQMAQALANQGCNIVCLARRKAMVEENAAMLEKASARWRPRSRSPTSSLPAR